eukprot:CAMPEP_0170503788 /NCGR_PEP_ID=MMETSP0208-20121228/45916_1 /TAXON_ID=197538 /ORGANISM="Strombidium inclinatum, Strain S3" /LENGTH=71 /DNA_ID=CAMNT_0010783635 /DNA_START=301 /DNA_END=513 /DNA_ORIENTATION=+
MRPDGSESGEKIVSKEDGEASVREILMQKIDSSDKKKAEENVNRLMKKYFNEDWEYYDAANQGYIETTRTP